MTLNININTRTILAVLFAVLVFAYMPTLIAQASDSSNNVLSALTGLSLQLSTMEDNMLGQLSSMNHKLDTIQSATGATVKSTVDAGVSQLMTLLYATVALLVVTLILCVVTLFIVLRARAPREKVVEKTKEKS